MLDYKEYDIDTKQIHWKLTVLIRLKHTLSENKNRIQQHRSYNNYVYNDRTRLMSNSYLIL